MIPAALRNLAELAALGLFLALVWLVAGAHADAIVWERMIGP